MRKSEKFEKEREEGIGRGGGGGDGEHEREAGGRWEGGRAIAER